MHPLLLLAALTGVVPSGAQDSQASQSIQQSIPRVMRFSGTALDAAGRPMIGTVSLVFSLYDASQDGTSLWTQTITVELDAQGRYVVLLGTEGDGLPLTAFAANAAKWIGVQPAGQPELPRVQLLSVPYALKAADAETLGGKPISAFKLADPESAGASALKTSARSAESDGPNAQVISDNLQVDFTSGIGLRLNGPSNHLALQDSAEAGAGGWWYMYRQGADGRLRFYHNGADRAVFSADGRLGLGTASPTGQVHIAASANHLVFQDTAEAGGYWYQYAQGGDGKLHFWKNGVDRVVLSPTGNVNIGAVTPTSARLDVAQTTAANSFQDMTKFVNSDVNSVGAAVRGDTSSQFANAGAAGIAGYSNGTGGFAGYFRSTNAAGNGTTVVISTAGTGEALEVSASHDTYVAEILQSGSGTAARIYTGAAVATGRALVAANFNDSNASDVIYAEHWGTGTALKANQRGASGNIAIFQSNGTNVARIDKTGKGFFNGGTATSGADVAESFAVDGDVGAYEPGDVLEISEHQDRQLRRSSSAYSTRVVGVYATKPGVLLTDLGVDDDASLRVPLGVVGVIPTKVSAENGAIRRGDLLVAGATQGHAMKAGANPPVGSVLGKALADFTGEGTGRILVLVNVR